MKTQLPHRVVICVLCATHRERGIDTYAYVWYNYIDGEYIMG